MTKREMRFMEILGGNMIESALNGHLDVEFEINKSVNDLEFEENCAAIDAQFKEDCKRMDAEYEESVAKMREEYEERCARFEKFGTFEKEEEDIDISAKLDKMLKSF